MIILAYMLGIGEDELICDLAETYNVYEYRELPPFLVATLAVGLRDNSRIKMKIAGQSLTMEQTLLCFAVDLLQYNLWKKTKDGSKNRNRPESILKKMTTKAPKEELERFSTGEDFETWYRSKMR